MAKAIWVDEGNDAAYAKLAAYEITAPYYSLRDPRVTSHYLDNVRNVGFKPGLYVAWNWYPTLDGPAFAVKLDAELRRIAWRGNPPVCVDIETHDVGYIVSFFQRWRQLRPTRPTAWTLEGMQGGLFDSASVAAIYAAGVRVAPQFYDGNMGALGHSVILDLLIAGFPGARIDGMYDAARLPYSWRGFAFTQGRLP